MIGWRWAGAGLAAALLCAWVTHALAQGESGGAAPPTGTSQPVPDVDLQKRLWDMRVSMEGDQYVVTVQTDSGPRRLTPEQYVAAVYEQQQQMQEQGWVFILLNITGWVGIWWVALGFIGQLLFTGRFVVQWLVSEKQGKSVVPISFWWMSLLGAGMLIVYFSWRKDIVGVLGQAVGWIVYLRNLWLIYRNRGDLPRVGAGPATPGVDR